MILGRRLRGLLVGIPLPSTGGHRDESDEEDNPQQAPRRGNARPGRARNALTMLQSATTRADAAPYASRQPLFPCKRAWLPAAHLSRAFLSRQVTLRGGMALSRTTTTI